MTTQVIWWLLAEQANPLKQQTHPYKLSCTCFPPKNGDQAPTKYPWMRHKSSLMEHVCLHIQI